MRTRNLNADPDPDPATQINADPDPDPDPEPWLWIRDVYPGSRIRIFSIPDPASRVKKITDRESGSASKNLSIFYPKNCF
jgi:hypothetical protein